MTRSLYKWKKRKRKSKAQQKKELDDLQEDLFKILSQRVVRLVQDKKSLTAHRDVVTTYSFTHLSRVEDEGQVFASNFESLSGVRKGKGFHKERNEGVCDASHSSDRVKSIINDAVKTFLEKSSEFDSSRIPSQGVSHLSVTPKLSNIFTYGHQDKLIKPSLRHDDIAFTPIDIKSKLALHPPTDVTDIQSSSKINQAVGHNEENKSRIAVLNNDFSYTLQKLEKELCEPISHKYFWEESTEQLPSSSSSFQETGHASPGVIEKSSYAATSEASSIVDYSAEPAVFVPENVSKKSKAKKSVKDSKSSKEREIRIVNPKFKELCDISYVDVCCFSGCERLAVRYLKIQAANDQCPSVIVFNRVIHALAKKHNMAAVKFVFSLLRQQQLAPSLQTYAGCLECIGRTSDPDLLLCEKIVSEIDDSSHDLLDIANSCSYEGDDWDHVLKAIRLVRPNFEPISLSIVKDYESELLKTLNTAHPQRVEKNQYALSRTKEDMMKRMHDQMVMEKSGQVEIASISQLSLKEEKKLNSLVDKQERLKKEWKHLFCDMFVQSLNSLERKAENNLKMTIYPYLKLFPAEVYADIMMQQLEELAFLYDEMFSPSQNLIQVSLGRVVNRKYNIHAKVLGKLDEKVMKIYDKYMDQYLDPSLLLDNHRLMWMRAMGEHFDTVHLDTSTKKWPRPILKGVGKHLLDLVIQNLKVNANEFRQSEPEKLVPAFCTIFRPDIMTYTVAELKFHPVVSKVFGARFRKSFTFDPSVVPMSAPPVPWISKSMGSLLLGSSPLVRTNDEINYLDPLENVPDSQYSSVLDSLNALGACAWQMNKSILDLQMKMFNGGGDTKLKVAPPSSNAPAMPSITQDMNGAERAALYRERLHTLQQKNEMYSLWCTDLYRLSIANKFRDEIFWFPHSMDFRGRTYPLPPHFNHLGSDNVRGMLLFAKGKPLGTKGHDWLKIHLINLTGLKKRSSNTERLEYANSIMDEILDSADRPLTGTKWWQESDEPWQTLACCMELATIERYEGNKEDYVCHFPVHQDGSCNGLQHYAALGRDQGGAESVNLAPFERPQDVYSDVVALVEKERSIDADNGHEIAKALEGHLKRKVIKQTIMTTVYGVTRYGAKLQIYKQLKDIPDLSSDMAWNSSIYLRDKTFSSLAQMFTATKDIQDWLTMAAKLMSHYLTVDWITPLGFPVMQPYFKKVPGGASGISNKPNIMKQKNAFPPNYIHSLDSTHMMLTSLYCMHAGITFVSVHDCYWTHACDVEQMNKICREQFVNMHKQPLLETLSEHLGKAVRQGVPASTLEDPKHAKRAEEIDAILKSIPARGQFNLDDVLKSTYFFS